MQLATTGRPLAVILLLLAAALPARAQYAPGQPIAADFVDISVQTGNGLGVQVAAAEADIGVSTPITVPAGFTATYFGAAVTTFQVSANGFLTLNTTTTTSADGNGVLPATGTPNNTLAPFWDDLDNDDDSANLTGPNSEVDYYYDAPNNRLIVQWTNARRWFGNVPGTANLGALTFQAQLYASGVVEYHYATMTDPGVSYTVGLENGTGTIGLTSILNGSSPVSANTPLVRSNTALRYTLATGPVPQMITREFFFPQASGTCVGVARGILFVYSNQGATTLTVSGATTSGSAAFIAGTPRNAANTADIAYPVTLAPGASFLTLTTFNPAAGVTGLQSGTMTVNSDGGNLTVPLQASADTRGAGFAFRASLTPATCDLSGAAAPGTAFVPLTGHTKVTTYTSGTADDGRFNLALSTFGAAFPAVRFGRTDFTTLALSTNGSASTSTTASTTFYGANASTVNWLQAAAMNLTLAVTGDAAGVGGEPGLYYGLTDVDGNGTQELVITWWHAYDLGSTAGPAGQYLTTQLIVYRGARANEESSYEVRFPDGLDANGVAYRQNTGVADSGTDVSIENDAVTGITEPSGTESALVRFRSGAVGAGVIIGTPLYAAGGGATGARFQPETFATATGQAGWRMMGAPVRSATVGQLATLNLVQSITGQYPTFPADNLYTFYDGTAYVAATSTLNALTPGRGFLWYLYNQDLTPVPTADGGGTSVSYALPMRLEAVGAEPATNASSYPVQLSTAGNGFNLVANPVRDDLNVSGIASWAVGGTLVSAVPQVWDPNVGASGSYVAVSGSVAGWQGFFIQNTPGSAGASGLTIPSTARNTAGTFLGRTGLAYSDDRLDNSVGTASTATLAFELAGTDAATGRTTLDRAATLVLHADATPAWDLLDATKLAPLASTFATVGFQGTGYDAAPAVKSQESRPVATDGFDVPLVVDAAGTVPGLTLSWAGLDALPAAWAVELRDLVTGQTVDLRTAESYAFDVAAAPPLTLAPAAILAQTTTAAQAKATTAPRFVLHVTTGRTTATEDGAPTVFALAAPAPNPTAGAAVVSFDVPAASAVSVAVYDLLGRRVAVLAQGEVAAGRHTSRLEAGALAPGVYVVRMTAADGGGAGTFSAIRRVTVVR